MSASSVGFGYGATAWWFTEAYLKYEKHPAERTKYDAFEWENKFQLTEPNRYFVDLGLVSEIEIPGQVEEEIGIKSETLLLAISRHSKPASLV